MVKFPHVLLVPLCITLTLLILLLDGFVSLSNTSQIPYVAGGVPYLAVVLTTLWLPGRKYTVFFASLTSVLTLLLLVVDFTVVTGESHITEVASRAPDDVWMELLNRLLAVFAIWVTAVLTIQRKRSEEESRQLSTIVASTEEAIISKSMDGLITSWNGGASRLYQYDVEEIVGQSIDVLAVEQAPVAEAALMDPYPMVMEPVETLRKRKDGTVVHVAITVSPVLDSLGEVVGVSEIARDITERKRFEQALVEAKNNAERVSRLKSAFLTNMSHEIRTPLAGILGFTSLLVHQEDEEQEEIIEMIERSGSRLLDTVNSVLDLSMLESDTFVLRPRRVDVSGEVHEKVAMLQPLAQENELSLIAEVPDKMCEAFLDASCLDRILNNVIGNAIKFTDEGQVRVKVVEEPGIIVIRVADTGIGISPEFLGRIFNEFEQESSGLARRFDGSGLGLAITKRLVEVLDGTVTVESKVGHGSVFTIRLPTGLPFVGMPASIDLEMRTNRPSQPSRVLLIDDDHKLGTLVGLMLEGTWAVEVAEDEMTAMKLARQQRFDLVLQDINMGTARDGIDIMRALRKIPHYAAIPVVALTGYSSDADRDHLLRVGFDGYVSKPFKRHTLLDALQQASR